MSDKQNQNFYKAIITNSDIKFQKEESRIYHDISIESESKINLKNSKDLNQKK